MMRYFSNPFPQQQAFGPYASPGRVVHIPFLLMLGAAGWVLCGWHDAGRWLVIVYIVAGIYLGRDLAILAHYFLPATIIIVGLAVASLSVLLPTIRTVAKSVRDQQMLWPGIAGALVLIAMIIWRTRTCAADPSESSET